MLEVGCGPGRLAAALAERAVARVWAIDASAEMIEQARANVPPGVGLKVAEAEALPFRDRWFDRGVMRMTAHLVDRSRALPELRRVLVDDGRLVVATHDPARFSDHVLAPFFPSLVAIDSDRFPTAEQLERELQVAGFPTVRVDRLEHPIETTREELLAKIRGRAFSTFDLIPEEEYEDGLARAETELRDPVSYLHEWLIAVADCS